MRRLMLGVVAALVAAFAFSTASKSAETRVIAPNIVFVLVDDMRADDLRFMPWISRYLANRGLAWRNAYAVNPLCCPSRVNILTGQYAHNTGVMDNGGADGGFAAFDDSESIATWLDSAGYRTGFVGKYLNHYGDRNPNYVPPGWDEWRASTRGVYNYAGPTTYNVNGRQDRRGGYQTDVLTKMATGFVERNARSRFMLFLFYLAPHGGTDARGRWVPAQPAPRHRDRYDGVRLSRTPAFNEADMSDKPTSLRLPRLSAKGVQKARSRHERRLESLLAVDEGVATLVRKLRAEGVLRNTHVVFTSDNGLFAGEFRIPQGKVLPHEPSSRVPLLMRGPGLPRDAHRRQIVGLHDLAPTFIEWAGAQSHLGGFAIDGSSLMPLVRSPERRVGRDLLIEGRARSKTWSEYDAIRVRRWKYIEYVRGGIELYDLNNDPHEVRNLAGHASYAGRQASLASRLHTLRGCAAANCR